MIYYHMGFFISAMLSARGRAYLHLVGFHPRNTENLKQIRAAV